MEKQNKHPIKTQEPYLLKVEDLSVEYRSREIGTCKAVNHVSFTLKKMETLGLVGETGAGKTSIALSLLRLLPKPQGRISSGRIEFDGTDILQASEKEMQKIRGSKMSMIFQDPMTSLNPIDTIGAQVEEVILLHSKISRAEARIQAINILETVGIPAERFNEYPHQFSGGMKQRVVIAMALACSPMLLIADEPTTALDVTIQAQVLELIDELKQKLETSMILITHDLGVVAEMCDSVAIIYAGEIIEYGTAEHIFNERAHPYTIGLFNSLPSLSNNEKRLKPIPGAMPDPSQLPLGCKFSDRCDYCQERCGQESPSLTEISDGHFVKCFFAEEQIGKGDAK